MFSQVSTELVPMSQIKYQPTEGFHSDRVFIGEYFCQQGSSQLKFDATSTLIELRHLSFDFFPKTNSVLKVYADQSITFHCSSKSGQALKMIPDNEENFELSRRNSSAHTQIVEVTAKLGGNFSNFGEMKGKLTCLIDSSTDDKIVKEWEFNFVQPPELFLDNYAGVASCLSNANEKLVQTVKCRNAMHCKFMSQCLVNPTNCNFENQKQFYSASKNRCWVPHLNMGRNCVSVPYSHLNGLVKCSQPGNLMRTWEFFVSLDFLRCRKSFNKLVLC